MEREQIIRMAREAGLHLATDVNWMPVIGLEYAEKFAALVVAADRKKLFALLRQMQDAYALASDPSAIQTRGQA